MGVLDHRQNGVDGLATAGLAPTGQLIEQGQQGLPPLPRLGPQHLGAGRGPGRGRGQSANVEEIALRRILDGLPAEDVLRRRRGVSVRFRP